VLMQIPIPFIGLRDLVFVRLACLKLLHWGLLDLGAIGGYPRVGIYLRMHVYASV